MKVMEVVDKEGKHEGWMIFCPACECGHLFKTGMWTFDGNKENPTFNPSMLVRGFVGKNWSKATDEEMMNPELYKGVCHSYVRNGFIEFLPDCTHGFANMKVALTHY